MRNVVIGFLLIVLISCVENQTYDKVQSCESVSVNSFSNFLNVAAKTKESDLKKILGKASGGSFTDDRLVFIYKYESLKRIPISVYVNAETGKVQTVTIEVLGLNKNFDTDIEKASKKYFKNTCHSILLGKTPIQIIDIMGRPYLDNLTTDNVETEVRTLEYVTESGKINLRLNFYQSQNYRLSSIVVDWY
ncbi:MAG: hypothetical protein AB8B72_10720 [Crocinitomicaceae bacterium]